MKTLTTPTVFALKAFMLLTIIMISLLPNVKSQSTNNLIQLKGYPFEVLYSAGHEKKAKEIATKCDSAIKYMHQYVLGFKPVIKVYVLNPEDWKQHATYPVYGLPHYQGSKLIVAAEDNSFWKSFLPSMEGASPEKSKRIQKLFGTNNGNLSMERFFDLLTIHEVGHLFQVQDSVNFPRRWLKELFANLFLHTYIAEKEPDLLAVLEASPKLYLEKVTKPFEYTTLQDFELYYGTKMDPINYGWYQARFHIAAKQLYDAGGVSLLKALWHAFLGNKNTYTDNELKEVLTLKIPGVAKVMTEW